LRHNEGAGSLNFGMAADDEYFRQLTSERQALRYHKGFQIREYVKKAGDRNEALDCAVYGYAALLLFSRRMNPGTMWEQLRQELESGKKAPLKSKKKPPAAASSFVRNW
jgi:phage terminase large subunit GpA-like protein